MPLNIMISGVSRIPFSNFPAAERFVVAKSVKGSMALSQFKEKGVHYISVKLDNSRIESIKLRYGGKGINNVENIIFLNRGKGVALQFPRKFPYSRLELVIL